MHCVSEDGVATALRRRFVRGLAPTQRGGYSAFQESDFTRWPIVFGSVCDYMDGMSEEWMVRVAGQEYGPVETEALREWKAEGRLIPENEVRRVGEENWILAGSVREIFSELAPPPVAAEETAMRARSWREIFAETFQIYRRGFGRFLLFGLLSAGPMFLLQWTMPKLALPDVSAGVSAPLVWPAFSPAAVVALLLFLAVWPISTAGFQFVADDIVHDRVRTFGNQWRAALSRWGQVMASALFVYGAYFFWFFVPFGALLALAGSGQISVLGALLFLLISVFMVYMNARLFINFLFWQPAAALRPHGALSAIRESKELARCVPEKPKLERPLYRGAIVASVWLLLILILTFGVQLPFMVARFIGVANPEEAMALARTLAEAKTPDTLTILADVASAGLSLLMQPLLAAAFIVLYYDARARVGRRDADEL